MILIVQIAIILILAFTLISVYVEELRDRRRQRPHAIVEEVWLGEERRKSVRVPSQLEVIYFYIKKGKHVKKAVTENISTGGLKILAEEKLESGTELSLEIHTPGLEKPILAKGEVVWVEGGPRTTVNDRRLFGAGIKFTHIKQNDKDRFAHYIASVQKAP